MANNLSEDQIKAINEHIKKDDLAGFLDAIKEAKKENLESIETYQPFFDCAFNANSLSILTWTYQQGAVLSKFQFEELFFKTRHETLKDKEHYTVQKFFDLVLNTSYYDKNIYRLQKILINAPAYKPNSKDLASRLDAVSPVILQKSIDKTKYDEYSNHQILAFLGETNKQTKQFITGKITPSEFLENIRNAAEDKIEVLQESWEVWTVVKNILFALFTLGLGPLCKWGFNDWLGYHDGKPFFENSTSLEVRDVTNSISSGLINKGFFKAKNSDSESSIEFSDSDKSDVFLGAS